MKTPPKIGWNNTVIGRLCCRASYDISKIVDEVKFTWDLNGGAHIKLYDKRRNFYEIYLRDVEDFNILKQGGAWLLLGKMMVLDDCPIQGPQFIDEENFYKTKIWMHIKNTPKAFINVENQQTFVLLQVSI